MATCAYIVHAGMGGGLIILNFLVLTYVLIQRRAASYGAKVALVEVQDRLGGTCVNVGT